MEDKFVIKALAALAQPNRLQIFRSLVVRGNVGLTPAMIAETLGIPANTLSFHLKELMTPQAQNMTATLQRTMAGRLL
jgi:DNA-binding transcriptional ArsR family regulator